MQVYDAIGILKSRRASGQLGNLVVVHLGNNGTFTKRQFDQIMRILYGVDRVVFVNVSVPRPWEEPNNEVISSGVERYQNAELVDWYSASVNHPEYFYKDGYHLRPKAQKIYVDLVSIASGRGVVSAGADFRLQHQATGNRFQVLRRECWPRRGFPLSRE